MSNIFLCISIHWYLYLYTTYFEQYNWDTIILCIILCMLKDQEKLTYSFDRITMLINIV